MHDTDDPIRTRGTRRGQRGAALILTVVVIMVLTTLGMAMVAFTITEERSAVAYRDTLQTRMIAEAGVRIVQMAFAAPSDRALVPLYNASLVAGAGWDFFGTNDTEIENSLNAIGIYRQNRTALIPPRYSGNGNRLLTGPFGGAGGWASAFGGTYSAVAANDLYDLRFTRVVPGTTTVIGANWLDSNINNLLLASGDWNLQGGIITDISFYAAPATGGIQYGIATVRVTAEKYNGAELLARETVEAIIGDNNPKPAVLGNGDVKFMTQGGVMCGDGCEQIHANGNINVGAISGGEDPMVTASSPGTITGGSGSTQVLPNAIVAPEINPWDLSYRPTAATELAAYYLVTARRLEDRWHNADPSDNVAPRPCGLMAAGVSLSLCQDYNLEYDDVLPAASATAKPARTATDTPYMYRWDVTNNEWIECDSDGNTNLDCGPGRPTFNVTRFADEIVAGTGDTNDVPYNATRVPRTRFDLDDPVDGATVLVDGMFTKSGGGMNPIMTIIAVGSMTFSSSTTWFPAMANRTMWISGRDIDVQANCCAPSNTCATNLANNAAQSIVAVHGQLFSASQTALAGIVIAENRVNYDTVIVNSSTQAIDITKGDHSYSCGLPDWPWELPTKPAIFSLKSATN